MPAFDGDDIESHCAVRMACMACVEHSRCAYDLALLAFVDSTACCRKSVAGAVADFHKYEAIVMQHNQIDFAAAMSKIPAQWLQASGAQIVECRLLRDRTGFYCVCRSHGASSAASGSMTSISSVTF